MNKATRTKKSRSPFWGASKTDLANIRMIVKDAVKWEKAWNTPDMSVKFYNGRTIDMIVRGYGTMQFSDDVERRAWKRVGKRADYFEGKAAYDILRMKAYNPAAYQDYLLRQEVEGLRSEVAELRENVSH